MIDKWLSRSKFKRIYEKFVIKYFIHNISANLLTILGLIFGLLSSFSIFLTTIYSDLYLIITILAIFLMGLSFFFDTLDGTAARLKEPTVFGGILDIFCDRLVEISIIIAIVSTDPITLVWPGLFSLAAMILCISMFLLVGGILKISENGSEEKVIHYPAGLMERSETFILLLFLVLLRSFRFFVLWIFTILVFITALLRLKEAYKIFST